MCIRDSQNLAETFMEEEKHANIGQFFLDPSEYKSHVDEQTKANREYMAREGVQQYRDYYESDAEEQSFFEYLDNLPNRDTIRFMECFEDFTIDKADHKIVHLIPKREFNPELSAFSNLILDLVDFRDRVKPIAKDITMLDATMRYQPREVVRGGGSYSQEPPSQDKEESRHREIDEKSEVEEDAAVPDYEGRRDE